MSDWSVGWIRWGGAVCLTAYTSEDTVAPGGDVGTVPIFFDVITGLPPWAAVDDDNFTIDGDIADGFALQITVTGTITSAGTTSIQVNVVNGGVFFSQDQPTGTPGTDVPFTLVFTSSGAVSPATLYTLSINLLDPGGFGATLDAGATLEVCLVEPE